MSKVEDILASTKVGDVLDAAKLNKFLKRQEEEEKKPSKFVIVFAVIGIVVAVAAAIYGIYRFFTPDYLDDFEDDFDDDFDDFDTIENISGNSPAPTAADELDEDDNSDSDDVVLPDAKTANDVINLFSKVKEYLNKNIEKTTDDSFVPLKDAILPDSKDESSDKQNSHTAQTETIKPVIRIYSFDNFENFESAAHVVYPLYSDRNSLYKDKKNNRYYLVIEKITCTSSDFNKTCNILSEYGNKENMPASSLTFFDEHYECIIKKHAIQTIVKI